MGGAQAIAAFAFGTETVPKAQRIVGPGNIYVAAAKKILAGETGIDFVAGPTEILLISTDGDPRHLAADILAQAEHDVDAAAILLTTSREHAERVVEEVETQLAGLSTAEVARQAIDRNSAVVVCNSLKEACEISNDFAPEHLSIADESMLDNIENAGSVFVGQWSPEAAGDYASGPNHVLPTGGAALRCAAVCRSSTTSRSSPFSSSTAPGSERHSPGGDHAGARRRPRSARPFRGGASR